MNYGDTNIVRYLHKLLTVVQIKNQHTKKIGFSMKALSHECRMVTHKKRMKKRMTLTLPNDERLFKGSNGHETDINGCQKMAFVPHT